MVIKLLIPDDAIQKIEEALSLKLYPWQKAYILQETKIPDICPCLLHGRDKLREYCSHETEEKTYCMSIGRQNGRTLAHCIRLALSEGPPLDIRKPEKFSDHGPIHYAISYYRPMFCDVWQKLKDTGFKVREIKEE